MYLDLDENESDNKQAPKKRETGGHRRDSDRNMNKVLSDITSSLSGFKSRKRNPKLRSSSYSDDDVSSLDSSDDEYEYSEKSNEDEDDESNRSSLLNSNKKATRRKASKSKNKKSEKAAEAERSKQEPSDDMNPFHHFSELKDIQFKVSADQEQDISKFIENLDNPPEIFSFDVEKYMKPEVEFEGPSNEFGGQEPQRQYYEFMETPNVDAMNVPLIPPTYQEADSNLKQLSKKGDSGTSPVNKRSGKRDLLRQYIKGVSNQLISQTEPFASEDLRNSPSASSDNSPGPASNNNVEIEGAVQTRADHSAERDRQAIATRTKALIENYAVNLDAMNFGNSAARDKSSDDFIDNYYLLNDGSYKKEQPAYAAKQNKHSAYDIQIDRDLDKKFEDLTILKNGDPKTQIYPMLRTFDDEVNREFDQENVDQPSDI